jgi:hypothetical protein
VPVLADLAVLFTPAAGGGYSFVGVEVGLDNARRAPLLAAPQALWALRQVEPVVKIGVAVPISFDLDRVAFVGGFLRLTVETE